MNNYTMRVDSFLANGLEKSCQEAPGCCGRGEVIFDETAHFPDKHFMVVQVIVSEDPEEEPCWTQGVLFDPQGRESGCTEPGESFLGEYYVGDYCVNVEIDDQEN